MAANAVGLMSGTSMDGVDAALLTTDGETIAAFGPRLARPYAETERALLRRAMVDARGLADRHARPGALAEAEAMVTAAHAEAVERLIAEDGLAGRVDLVGFHGQTVVHAPERGLTVQIGDGQALADRLNLPVVFDFRAADVAAGGQGAPLVPVYHRALVARAGLAPPVAVVNIGGVANITLIGEAGRIAAFDTGPGNALIDDFVFRRTGAAMDEGGTLASAGRVHAAALARLLDHPFFAAPPPKSLDRNAFSTMPVEALSTEDGAATLAEFTARSIATGIRMVGGARLVVVAGGGARNPVLLARLAAAIDARVVPADELGWSADFLEAEAFAFLAVRAQRGRPLTYPATTGVRQPQTGGVLVLPRR